MGQDNVKMVFKLGGEQVDLRVQKDDEPYFSDARKELEIRMNALSAKYAAHAHTKKLLISLAVESMVNCLKASEKYHRLRHEIENRLTDLQTKSDS